MASSNVLDKIVKLRQQLEAAEASIADLREELRLNKAAQSVLGTQLGRAQVGCCTMPVSLGCFEYKRACWAGWGACNSMQQLVHVPTASPISQEHCRIVQADADRVMVRNTAQIVCSLASICLLDNVETCGCDQGCDSVQSHGC